MVIGHCHMSCLPLQDLHSFAILATGSGFFVPLPSYHMICSCSSSCHPIHMICSCLLLPSQLQFKSSFAIATKGHVPVPCCVCSIMISSIFLIICSCAFLHLFSQQRFCFIRPSVYLPVSVFTGLFKVVRIRMGLELFAGSGTIRKEQINKILFLILGL